MEGDTDIYRDIGRLSEAVRQLQGSVERMNGQLQVMEATLAEAKGGWRTLLWLGGAAGSVGAAIGVGFHKLFPGS